MDIMCRVDQDLNKYLGSLKEGYQPNDYRKIDFEQCLFSELAFNKRLREICLDEIGSNSPYAINCFNQMINKMAEFMAAIIADDADEIYDIEKLKKTTHGDCLLSIMMGDEHFRKTTFETFQ
jgi:hypothetical protein